MPIRRVPPHSVEAERAVLGAILKDSTVLDKVRQIVEPGHFYVQGHQVLFSKMLEMAGNGEPIDLVTTLDKLKRDGRLGVVGEAHTLWELLDATPTVDNAGHYAGMIKNDATLRSFRDVAMEVQDLVENGSSVGEVSSHLENFLGQAKQSGNGQGEDRHAVYGAVPELCKFLGEGINGLSTGFPALDRKLLGMRGIVCLGAPPKVGKSVFCLNVALHVAQTMDEAKVLYYDVENGQNIVMLRLLSNFYRRTFEELRQDRERGGTWEADLKEKLPNLYLCTDHSLMKPDTIGRHIQKAGAGKTLVVLDSLQKLPSLSRERRDSIDLWLRELEKFKTDSSVTILIVSELSRGEGEINYRRPSLGAYKESGGIEYSSDIAFQFTKAKTEGLCALHVVANRHGESGHIANYSYEQFKHWRWLEVPS